MQARKVARNLERKFAGKEQVTHRESMHKIQRGFKQEYIENIAMNWGKSVPKVAKNQGRRYGKYTLGKMDVTKGARNQGREYAKEVPRKYAKDYARQYATKLARR